LIFAQEHVKNGSFELGINCPMRQALLPKYWVGLSSPDYYKSCDNSATMNTQNVPYNQWGNQYAKEGIAYVGIWSYKEFSGELIQTKLRYSLQKNQSYYVEFFASRADKDHTVTSSLGVYLTNNSKASKRLDAGNKFINNYSPYVSNPDSNFLSDPDIWYKISGSFVAKGGEQYLLIGNSKKQDNAIIIEPENKKHKKKKQTSAQDFYYYIDCVSLWPIDSAGNKIDIQKTEQLFSLDSIKKGTSTVLDNIYFETGKAILQADSYEALDNLIGELNEMPEIKLEISGHTDNSGIENNNLELSELRAKSVVEYLTAKGISPDRLIYKGYGSLNPIASNKTEDGKKKNRRVEFMILNE